ncbi:MAG: DEAD/DEAH box helicase [Actinobacteria bacterium]|nr:DEAD/DEAH box helicase [Actinomycetota bacterium]
MSSRAEFESARGFALDDFQRDALDALDAGRSVLVAAPTGSGKTLVAEYAIERALALGGKIFYTTPLKALSNQKFGDFRRAYGDERVGLLTGDTSVNGDAPIVVMTTEVLRNMIYAASGTLSGLRYVVLDEVHYLQDRYRGAVWEEVIIHLDPEVDLVCLSATVSNAEELAAWIETVRGATTAVIEERRPVVLHHRYLLGERGMDGLHLLPTFAGDDEERAPNPDVIKLDRRTGRYGGRGRGRARSRLRPPLRTEMLDVLVQDRLLPAIVFVFSRAGCDQAVEQCRAGGARLTTKDEAARIRAIADAHTAGLNDDDLAVLGFASWRAALEAGLASHHAGLVPPMKEAVEEAFAAGLLKVVFATETLALGINMPARSVVIEKLTKFTGERHEMLTPGEYTQLTGRAGRRGIDDVGYAIVCWSPWVTFEQVAGLASRRTDALRSSFRPTYNMTVNLVRRYSSEAAHHLLNLSFAQFHADRDVVSLERQLERARSDRERAREATASSHGEVAEYQRLRQELDAARREQGSARRTERALLALQPGDVVWTRHRGKVAVISRDERRGDARLLAVTPSRQLVRLGAGDFDDTPEAVARVDLPEPFAPKSKVFQHQVADAVRKVKARRPASDSADPVETLTEAIRSHPVHEDPRRESRVRALHAVERLERDIARLERRVRGRSESLARQLDQVRDLLVSWGYLDGWALTPPGELLARLYTETDLLLAESIRDGLLDGASAPEIAALVSCFAYERRGADDGIPMPPPRWPSSLVAERARAIEKLWRSLSAAEDDAGLPETRPPDPGFTAYAYEWARGDDLSAILDDDELAGGDFVRNIKQCIDLLGQVAEVAPDPTTRHSARAATDACLRGVVRAASVVA